MAKVWRRHGEGSTQLLPRKHVAIGYIFGMLSEREKSSGAGGGAPSLSRVGDTCSENIEQMGCFLVQQWGFLDSKWQ